MLFFFFFRWPQLQISGLAPRDYERIVGRHPSVVVDADDLAVVIGQVLRREFFI
jgi:hypothetical protein